MMALLGELGNLLWTVGAFVVALSIIVAVHEYGHYIVGRWSGIRAEVFSIGFGPRLLSWRDRRGTLWQVAAVPLGGYVRFLGDANAASAGTGAEVDPALRRQSLTGAPLWARVATVAAGPVFNFILSIAVFAGMMIWSGVAVERVQLGAIKPLPPQVSHQLQPGDEVLAIGGQPVADWRALFALDQSLPLADQHDWHIRREGAEMVVPGPDPNPAFVSGVAPRSAASNAGLRAGDVVLAVDGAPIHRFSQIRDFVERAEGAPIVLRVWREGVGEADYTLSAHRRDLPAPDGGFQQRWMIGVTGGGFLEPETRPTGLVEALQGGVVRTWDIIASSLTGIWAMVTGQIGTCNIGGAISIAETTAEAASAGGSNFIWWIAVLSAAIGFLNLLPIPVLDGGHLVFYAYEAVTGRPASDRVINFLTLIGLAMVVSLMIFGLSNDLFCP